MTDTEVQDMKQWICKTFPLCGRGKQMMHAMEDVGRLLEPLPVSLVEDTLAERAAGKGKWGTTARWICHELRSLRERLVEERQEQDTPYPMWPLPLKWPEGTIIIRGDNYEQARIVRHVKAQIRDRDATAHALEGPSRLMGEVKWRPQWSFKRIFHRSYVMDVEERDALNPLAPDDVLVVRTMWADWKKAGVLIHETKENRDWAQEVKQLIERCQ